MGNKKKNTSIKELLFNDVVYSEESEIANKFNDFFGGIAGDLNQNIPSSIYSPTDFMGSPSPNSLLFQPVTEAECINIIKKYPYPHRLYTCKIVHNRKFAYSSTFNPYN